MTRAALGFLPVLAALMVAVPSTIAAFDSPPDPVWAAREDQWYATWLDGYRRTGVMPATPIWADYGADGAGVAMRAWARFQRDANGDPLVRARYWIARPLNLLAALLFAVALRGATR